jgi:hypothetical protein
MLQLSVVASSIIENGYISDYQFFLELVYIALTGNQLLQMHSDIAEYRFIWPTPSLDNTRTALMAWGKAMAAELSMDSETAELESEVVAIYGAILAVKTKIFTCEHFGDREGAEKIRAALR